MRRWVFIAMLACLVCPSLSGAATYWVDDTGGSDSNACNAVDGTSDPGVYKRTITGASGGLTCLTQPGDILIIKAGTYSAGETNWRTTNRQIARGTPSANTVVRGEDPNNRPIFRPGGNSGGGGELTGAGIRFDRSAGQGGDSYIEIRNLIVDGTDLAAGGKLIGRALMLGKLAHHIRVDNVVIRNFHETNPNANPTKSSGLMVFSGSYANHFSNMEIHDVGNSARAGGHLVYFAGDDSIFEDNYVHDARGDKIFQNFASSSLTTRDFGATTTWQTADRNIIRRNRFAVGTAINDHMLVLEGHDNRFYDNIIEGSPTRAGDCLVIGHGPETRRNLIYNNVIYNCQGDGISVGDFAGTAVAGTRIINNIITNVGGAAIRVGGRPRDVARVSGTHIEKNTFHGNGRDRVAMVADPAGTVATGPAATGTVTTDPRLTNVSGGDFTLQGGSPAIDAGTSVICSAADVHAGRCARRVRRPFAGANRDMGRWESGAVSPGSLVSRYLLDENADDAEHSLTGTAAQVTYATASPTPAEGTHSARFNGTTSFISAPTTGLRLAAQTQCAAFYPESLAGVHAIMQTRTLNPTANRFGLYHHGTALRAEVGGEGSFTTTVTLGTDQWAYACLVRSGSEGNGGSGTWRVVYRDPNTHALSEVGSGPYHDLTQLPATWTIGNFSAGDAGAFNGHIDAVSTYNTALSDADILADCEDVFGEGACANLPH